MGTDDERRVASRQTLSGPQGKRIAHRVETLRGLRRLTLAQLADRLSSVGHPLRSTALHKIEKGDRRVDVLDLVALALALDVSPNALLLPPSTDDDEVQLTTEVAASQRDAWRWALGEAPLPHEPSSLARLLHFREQSRPGDDDTGVYGADRLAEYYSRRSTVAPVIEAVSAALEQDPDLTVDAVLGLVRGHFEQERRRREREEASDGGR